mmetsp:Transcript_41740/g.117993  ORF Transcript_41740/g.117993 Transcript_41740/m.117993 type:complete len:530 (+) Transcript_41740:672-2261(+)
MRRLREFKRTLSEPHDIWIRGAEARKKFRLTKQDLLELGNNYIVKESPYEAAGEPFRQYLLKEIVGLAKRKHGDNLMYYYSHYLQMHVEGDRSRKLYGHWEEDLEDKRPARRLLGLRRYWYDAPSGATTEGRKSVVQGLYSNVFICLTKGLVWFFTGSHAVFADWMHSIADVVNYSYRLMELNYSTKQRDHFHPYGYAPRRYITADRSFVFLGVVGGILPLLSGVRELVEAQGMAIQVGDHLPAAALVFCVSAALELVAVSAAYHEILSQAARERIGVGRGPGPGPGLGGGGRLRGLAPVLSYLREGRDVMSTATFTESFCGVVGAGVGVVGLGFSQCLQSGTPDAVASVVMASMVCASSSFLLHKSGIALLGQTLPKKRVEVLVRRLEAHAAVVHVYDVKTEMIGTDTVRFKAEVQFNPQTITERILRVSPPGDDGAGTGGEMVPAAISNARIAQAALTEQLSAILPQLHRGVLRDTRAETDVDAASWLYRNNGLFYEALAWELKDVERVIRGELDDFRHVHIDLEPW